MTSSEINMKLGVWMWPESLRLRGADAVFDACRRGGVTDVYFLTKGLAGTAAFITKLAPPMIEGRDLLREALDAAHSRDIRLHAWFTSASDARYKNDHPESGLCHYTKGRNRDIISITDSGYISFTQSVVRDMLKNYDIDGLHLDYIRYNHLIYGWSDDDERRYADFGVNISHIRELMDKTFLGDSPDGDAIFNAFRRGDRDAVLLSKARRANVMNFARAITEAAHAENSTLTISAALMPEGAYDDLAFSDLHYGQNYSDLSEIMGEFLPMSYSRAYEKDAGWVKETALGTVRYGVPSVIGVHAYEGGTGETLAQDIKAASGVPGVRGVCLFREGASVWAFCRGGTVSILNPFQKPLGHCLICVDGTETKLETPVAPLEEKEFNLPFTPEYIRAFDSDGGEVCVYMAEEKQR